MLAGRLNKETCVLVLSVRAKLSFMFIRGGISPSCLTLNKLDAVQTRCCRCWTLGVSDLAAAAGA